MQQPSSWHLDAALVPSLPFGIRSQRRVASSMRGETAEGQALHKVIETLATGTGEFSESDVWLFSAERLALADALVDARLKGRYPDEDWRR